MKPFDKLAVRRVAGMEGRFVILLGDSKLPDTEFMETIGPFTETDARNELSRQQKKDTEIDSLISDAKTTPPV
jgi:hypothetical protein